MKANYDEYFFCTESSFPLVWGGPPANLGPVGPNEENAIELRGRTGNVILSDDPKQYTLIYIHNSVSYDGLRKVFGFRAGRYYSLVSPYDPAGADGWEDEDDTNVEIGAGFKSPDPHELGGFAIAFSAAPGRVGADPTQVVIHSAKGTYYDSILYSQDMFNVTDVNHMFGEPIPLFPNDRVEVTMGQLAVNSKTVSVRLFIRRV